MMYIYTKKNISIIMIFTIKLEDADLFAIHVHGKAFWYKPHPAQYQTKYLQCTLVLRDALMRGNAEAD